MNRLSSETIALVDRFFTQPYDDVTAVVVLRNVFDDIHRVACTCGEVAEEPFHATERDALSGEQ
jgi:hypothetical protein